MQTLRIVWPRLFISVFLNNSVHLSQILSVPTCLDNWHYCNSLQRHFNLVSSLSVRDLKSLCYEYRYKLKKRMLFCWSLKKSRVKINNVYCLKKNNNNSNCINYIHTEKAIILDCTNYYWEFLAVAVSQEAHSYNFVPELLVQPPFTCKILLMEQQKTTITKNPTTTNKCNTMSDFYLWVVELKMKIKQLSCFRNKCMIPTLLFT